MTTRKVGSKMPRSGISEFAQDVPNTENRHIRLVGQPVTLSQTPSGMAARPPVSVDDFANCNSDSD
jgi:hypothetical protein